ncbi:hypothetical protein UFOVP235_20 [uncultured Caudovirales phage]|uniref:Uncharacterized protein n=1 Tax=uncultured Caudovirales phage TaxID=2100421 RepID=A0A6J7WZ16_9CAUD|nr:hypothetical protein UFOVP235_20 [uncultured Caudovirales phage]
MKTQDAIKALDELTHSKGWNYLREIMRTELVEAAMAIANAHNPTEQDLHFRRGAMWAAVRLIELPDRLSLRLQNEIALNSSAKAEKGID